MSADQCINDNSHFQVVLKNNIEFIMFTNGIYYLGCTYLGLSFVSRCIYAWEIRIHYLELEAIRVCSQSRTVVKHSVANTAIKSRYWATLNLVPRQEKVCRDLLNIGLLSLPFGRGIKVTVTLDYKCVLTDLSLYNQQQVYYFHDQSGAKY